VEGVGTPEDDARFNGHPNVWESRQLALTLAKLGLAVDVVDYRNRSFSPACRYDVVIGIDSQAARLAEAARAPRYLLHLTGSDPVFQNEAELARLDALAARRGTTCRPRRQVEDVVEFEAAIASADACSLLGNDATLATYPEAVRTKTTCIPVSAAKTGGASARPDADGFLWFGGRGAVHKGLDLTLEAFASLPAMTLHVVGPIRDEEDFVAAYRRELTRLANVHVHGYLDPAGRRFGAVVRRSFALVAPSCSEGCSTAVVTGLHLGLMPLISRQTGVNLPPGAGLFLEGLDVGDVAAVVRDATAVGTADRLRQSETCRSFAQRTYTRERFAVAVSDYLRSTLRL
jgi:glycosyltransferase involved in cell wall biosynthesis